jgi:cytochrome c2
MRTLGRGALILMVVLAAFALGVLFQKIKFFPYAQMKNAAWVAVSAIKGKYVNPREVLSQQSVADSEKFVLDRNIDTSLLPLKLSGIRISDYYAAPKVGGAITTIGDRVIVLDRLGALYSYRPGDPAPVKLGFPPLPNNIEDYVLQAGSHLDVKTFRAYSVKYMEAAKLLAVSHEAFDKPSRSSRIAVSVIGIDVSTMRAEGTWRTVFLGDAEPDGPNDAGGGRIVTNGSDKIILTTGDYLIPAPAVSQDPNSSFGKIIEINLADNSARKLTLGHRNPQGLVMTKSGVLLSTEHGPAGGDELNVITEGSNYGWPIVTLGTEYESYGWRDESRVGKHTGYAAPQFAWVPSIGVSNLIQVETFHRRWEGDLLVGSLKAETLYRLRWDGTRVVFSEPIWIGQRIRDLAELNGMIALWTDDTQLQFIGVDQKRLEADIRPAAALNDTLFVACMYCHHFGPTKVSDSAPTLSRLFARKIGSDNYRYSAGLRNKEGNWNEARLREFLTRPDKFANGTSMPQPTLTQQELNEIIDTLKSADDMDALSPGQMPNLRPGVSPR